jgi:hypothetical protein
MGRVMCLSAGTLIGHGEGAPIEPLVGVNMRVGGANVVKEVAIGPHSGRSTCGTSSAPVVTGTASSTREQRLFPAEHGESNKRVNEGEAIHGQGAEEQGQSNY